MTFEVSGESYESDIPVTGMQGENVAIGSNPNRGMFHKYVVLKTEDMDVGITATEEPGEVRFTISNPVEDAFVLRPSKDFHARVALAAYIESVRLYDEHLADDMEQFLALTMPRAGVKALKVIPD